VYNAVTKGICNTTSCKVMGGGPKYEYHWSDKEIVKPIIVSAPQYVALLSSWGKKQLESESLFPTKPGVLFPVNFREVGLQICRRLWRVYVHIFWHHFEKITSSGHGDLLNSHFKNMFAFVFEFDMVGPMDINPVEELVENLFQNDATYHSKKEQKGKAKEATKETKEATKETKEATKETKEEIETTKDTNDDKDTKETKVKKEENEKKDPTKLELRLLVDFEGIKRRWDTQISTLEELRKLVQEKFEIIDHPDLLLEYYDEEFQDFALLDDLKQLMDGKARLQLRYKPKMAMSPRHSTLPRNFRIQKITEENEQFITRSPRSRTISAQNLAKMFNVENQN